MEFGTCSKRENPSPHDLPDKTELVGDKRQGFEQINYFYIDAHMSTRNCHLLKNIPVLAIDLMQNKSS